MDSTLMLYWFIIPNWFINMYTEITHRCNTRKHTRTQKPHTRQHRTIHWIIIMYFNPPMWGHTQTEKNIITYTNVNTESYSKKPPTSPTHPRSTSLTCKACSRMICSHIYYCDLNYNLSFVNLLYNGAPAFCKRWQPYWIIN